MAVAAAVDCDDFILVMMAPFNSAWRCSLSTGVKKKLSCVFIFIVVSLALNFRLLRRRFDLVR